MAWTEFQLTVTTPLFTQVGVPVNTSKTDPTLPVASIRGVMRYWFRALAGTRVGNDVKALRTLEDAVFGHVESPAPVRFRITNPRLRSPRSADNNGKKRGGDWIAYLKGQGLQDKKCIGIGSTFNLKVALSGDDVVDSLTLASLWLACTYGGFGARTRRGFGGIRLKVRDGTLPAEWTESEINTPGMKHYRELEYLPVTGVLEKPLEHVETLLHRKKMEPAQPRFDNRVRPLYPVLGEGVTTANLSSWCDRGWNGIATTTGERYRLFRATEDNSGSSTTYSPKVATPERRILRTGKDSEFPLGALGLPIGFKGNETVNLVQGAEELRRASPLWLRFVGDDRTGEWRLFSFVFLNRFKPESALVRHNKKPVRRLTVTDEHVDKSAVDWLRYTSVPVGEAPEPPR